MTYVVKARVRQDLKMHWGYIARDNPDAADRLLRSAEETFELIARNPDIGSLQSFRKHVGVRSKAIDGFDKYLIFCRSEGQHVVFIRVLHGIGDLPRFFRRR